MKVTRHGGKRTTERMGLPKKAIERQFALALERGHRHGSTKGKLHKWITSVALSGKYASSCIVYNNHLFVTDKNETLITVLKVPANLVKDINSFIKK